MTKPGGEPEQQPADPQSPDSMTRTSETPPAEGRRGPADDGRGTREPD